MTAGPPEVSVIIVSWNSGDVLGACLESVGEAVRGRPAEILLVDNASEEDVGASVPPGVRLLRNEENVGFAKAVNRGISEASGRAFLLLNPDTQIEAETVERLVEALEEDERIGIVGCGSLNADGEEWPQYETSYPGQREVEVVQEKGLGKDVAWVSGACLAARPEMVKAIGPLDEGFFMYYEDVDWCRRAREAGWRVVTLPGVRIVHQGGTSAAKLPKPERERLAAGSRVRFFREHYSAGRARWLVAGMALSALAGVLLRVLPAIASGAARGRMREKWAVLVTAIGSARAR